MKDSHIVGLFSLFVAGALTYTWVWVTDRSVQISGALRGVPGTEPISAFMASLLVVWLLLLITVIYLGKHR